MVFNYLLRNHVSRPLTFSHSSPWLLDDATVELLHDCNIISYCLTHFHALSGVEIWHPGMISISSKNSFNNKWQTIHSLFVDVVALQTLNKGPILKDDWRKFELSRTVFSVRRENQRSEIWKLLLVKQIIPTTFHNNTSTVYLPTMFELTYYNYNLITNMYNINLLWSIKVFMKTHFLTIVFFISRLLLLYFNICVNRKKQCLSTY